MQTPIKSKINDEHNPVPENTILVVTEDPGFDHLVDKLIEPLAGKPKRDWFVKHAYFCLPLTVGNQYGFAIKSAYNFTAEWNGGVTPADLTVTVDKPGSDQMIFSHFGMGVITIQNRFHFRTPLGINLITLNPPNMFIPHLQNLTGVVETDNLRRDFTFNLKITVPNIEISVKKGDPLGAFIPIPRYFVDRFSIKLVSDIFDKDSHSLELNELMSLGKERTTIDLAKPHQSGRRYFNGLHTNETEYPDHQKRVPK